MENQKTESVGKLISIIHRQAQIYLNAKLNPYGLNYSEYISLANLSPDNSGNNQKHLSDILIIDGALTTRAMKSLENKGYIIREKSKSDKRANNVKLTIKGIEMQPIILSALKDWTDVILEGMNEEEKDDIIQKLTVMSANALNVTKGTSYEKT
ncbi:MarR family winged helix-turn-helix transcriptional regulator [Fusibacter ferrireducens]|uniref:HTH-type transcriptional regulator SarZ n=1 Tax=Fusibacter ferrireducens TaxID=2785058 RepID=A0ABR9ZQF0_9FIRM|nr:MarR family winged helix-turn-helix transcriptional regulator [Fusibacter ferrireducens]MBF4692690.1 winged helix-turn-helix transcriptional regulator [Fusibacter ferrireducens]